MPILSVKEVISRVQLDAMIPPNRSYINHTIRDRLARKLSDIILENDFGSPVTTYMPTEGVYETRMDLYIGTPKELEDYVQWRIKKDHERRTT